MARNAMLVAIMGMVALAPTLADEDIDSPAAAPDGITFRAVDTDDGPRVQIEVGGLVMQSEQLTILHEAQPATEVTTAEERVEMRYTTSGGGGVMRAKVISTRLQSGLLDYSESSRYAPDVQEFFQSLFD